MKKINTYINEGLYGRRKLTTPAATPEKPENKKEVKQDDIITGYINVIDCEHEGDISDVRNFINSIGKCKYVSEYWDGKDCGEAYVTFTFKTKDADYVYDKIKNRSVSFNKDISVYLKSDEKYNLKRIKRLSSDELREIEYKCEHSKLDELKKHILAGFSFRVKGKFDIKYVHKFLREIRKDFKSVKFIGTTINIYEKKKEEDNIVNYYIIGYINYTDLNADIIRKYSNYLSDFYMNIHSNIYDDIYHDFMMKYRYNNTVKEKDKNNLILNDTVNEFIKQLSE